jgi:alpha-1,2-mannosyltransferase
VPDKAPARPRIDHHRAILLAIPPAILSGVFLGIFVAVSPHWDFHVFWSAGRNVLAGIDPYPPVDTRVLATEQTFVYPAPAAFAFVPLALLPLPLAAGIFAALSFAAVALALAVLGVRDPRCYGAAFLSPAIAGGISLGALSPFLLLGIALLWKYRDRLRTAAALTAALMISKLFLWPLLIWLAFTRRTRVALLSVALTVAASAAGWAALGFGGFGDYPRLLAALSDTLEHKGHSAVALGLALGLPEAAARAVAVSAGLSCLGLAAVVARRQDGERTALAVTLAAALLLSPIVWTHYFALVFVPIALRQATFSPLWLLPLAMWLSPGQSHGDAPRVVLCLGAALLALAVAADPGRRGATFGRKIAAMLPTR